MKKNLLLFLIAFIVLPGIASALTEINSSTTFPYNANTAGETYQLSEDISCDTPCIIFGGSADNEVLDLNGHTMTFGTANAVTVANADFENWTGSVPDNWTVVTGSVESTSAIDWGTYDLSASDSFKIRSDTFSLIGGQTYHAWAFVKSSSSASATLRILDASDDSVLAYLDMTGNNHLNRGFAVYGDEGNALKYKPETNISVKLELETSGTYAYRVAEINMAPSDHYGVVAYGYQNTTYFPDLSGFTWGAADNVTVQNGTIAQGNGGASYSMALFSDATNSGWIVDGVTITVSGPNSGGVRGFKEITDSTINGNSVRVFNRMYAEKAACGVRFKGYSADITVS